MSRSRVDRWQMNAARALGNLGDPAFVPDLERSLVESPYANVRAMSAWSLGRVGSPSTRGLLEKRLGSEEELVAAEIKSVLEQQP